MPLELTSEQLCTLRGSLGLYINTHHFHTQKGIRATYTTVRTMKLLTISSSAYVKLDISSHCFSFFFVVPFHSHLPHV